MVVSHVSTPTLGGARGFAVERMLQLDEKRVASAAPCTLSCDAHYLAFAIGRNRVMLAHGALPGLSLPRARVEWRMTMFRPAPIHAAIACAAALLAPSVSRAQCDLLKPDNKIEWKVLNTLSERKDVSGAACVRVKDDLRRCIVAVDEGFAADLVTLQGTTLRQDDTIRLVPEEFKELDAEAAAYDPATASFYVIGSHGRGRHDCADNPGSFRLLRFPVDAKSGELKFDHKSKLADPKWVAKEIVTAKTSIRQAMENSKELAKYVDKCLGTKPSSKKKGDFEEAQGVNIEGLAILDTHLYAGLRGPVVGDSAFLIRFNRDAVFDTEQAKGETVAVALGKGNGVRDLAAVPGGLLILSGPEDDEIGAPSIYFFEPQAGTATCLGTLPALSPKGKPEALLVLENAPDAASHTLLVLSDSAENGIPTQFTVRRQK
jgi:Protein of unknown function (DUF3616)